MFDDDDWARQILELPKEKRMTNAPPPMSSFSKEAELLTLLVETTMEVRNGVLRWMGNKPTPVRPLPRPQTALDRLEKAAQMERHFALVAEAEVAMSRWERKNA